MKMRRCRLWLIVLGVVAALSLPLMAWRQAPKKRALLVGISDYRQPPPGGKFEDLDTAGDIKAIKGVLMEKFFFREEEIRTLTTKSETERESILKNFNEFLIEPTGAGDIVFFYYAGHGSQIDDPNEPDGLDETLVPSDYRADGSKDIRDKEIAKLLASLKQRRPAAAVLGFDCCHSATAYRVERDSYAKVRGLSYETRFGKKPEARQAAQTMTKLAGEFPLGSGFVVISACQDDQLAVQMLDDDHQPIGRLSYFLSKALLDARENTTYRDLFEIVESRMAQRYPGQIPNIEGDKDQVLLKGVARNTESYIPVYISPSKEVMLRAGFLHGLTEGSRFALYPQGTQEFLPDQRIAEAKIIKLGAVRSVLEVIRRIKSNVESEEFAGARAKEILHVYGDEHLKVNLQQFKALRKANDILAAIQPLATGEGALIVGPLREQLPDVQVLNVSSEEIQSGHMLEKLAMPRPGDMQALVRTEDGAIIEVLHDAQDLPQRVRSALQRESKYRAVRLLNNDSPTRGIKVEMRIVPAQVISEKDDDVFQHDLPYRSSYQFFEENEWITVEVRNTGSEDAYITLFDLQSDGTVNQLWPPLDPTKPVTNKLRKEERTWHKLWAGLYTSVWPIRISRPYGVEIFKLIATRDRVDLSSLRTRRAQTPLEQLLQATLAGARTRQEVAPGDWATSSAVFAVKEKQVQR